MSQGSEVERLLDELEALVAQDLPDAPAIAAWKTAFDAAAARAERGPHWAAVLARADALGAKLQARIQALQTQMSGLVQEASAQEAGVRALKGYGSASRS